MKCANLQRKPSVLIVKDVKDNVENLCEAKIGDILGQLGGSAVLLSSKKDFWKFSRSPEKVAAFREGRTSLVIQALENNIKNFNDLIVFAHDISDMVIVLDESDAMWSTYIDPEKQDFARTSTRMTSREREAYRLLAGVDSNGRGHGRLFGNNRVRNLFSISATHLATLEWQSMWRTAYRPFVVNIKDLKERGYALYDCLDPLKNDSGIDVFLDPSEQNARGDYNVYSGPFNLMLDVFHADSLDPTKEGLLLMIGMTPKIRAGPVNANQVMDLTLTELWKKGQAIQQEDAGAKNPVGLVLCQGGPYLAQIKVRRGSKKKSSKKPRIRVVKEKLEVQLPGIADIVAEVDRRFGLETPLVVTGYTCLNRGRSVRSSKRVITHSVVAPTKGMSAANVQQMVMRCGGNTVSTRQANGFDKVTVLMIEKDFRLVQRLYEFTIKALCVAGTGRAEDVDAWKALKYAAVFTGVLQMERQPSTGQLGKVVKDGLRKAAAVQKSAAAAADVDDADDEAEADFEDEERVENPDAGSNEMDIIRVPPLIRGTLTWKAMRAFYRIFFIDNTEVRDVDYKALREDGGFNPNACKRNVIATQLCNRMKLVRRIRNGVYRLTELGLAVAKKTFGNSP